MSDDAERAYYAWRTVILRRQSTDLDEACEALVREAWQTAYRRGRIDGFGLSASLRGAMDILESTAVLLRAWELEHEAIDLVGTDAEEPDIDDEPPPDVGPHVGAVIREWDDDREPIQPGDYHYYNPR